VPRRVVPILVAALAVAAFVWLAWPASPNPEQRRDLEALRASPVPVLVPLLDPDWRTTAEVTADGYVLKAAPPGGAPLAVTGSRTEAVGEPEPNLVARARPLNVTSPSRIHDPETTLKDVKWSESGVTYILSLPELTRDDESADRVEHLQPLELAIHASQAWPGDTPLLYLVYLPLFGLVTLCTAWLMIATGVAEGVTREVGVGSAAHQARPDPL
jgi:hypothetical protein